MRWLLALLVLLCPAELLASDWPVSNRLKPGEQKTYQWQAIDDPSILDARACASTIFTFQSDIVGTDTNSVATLYTCPQIDSTVPGDCHEIIGWEDDQHGMNVNEKPGFYAIDIHTQANAPAIAQITAFCSDIYSPRPNYIRKEIIFDEDLVFPTGIVDVPINVSNYTKGYFTFTTTNAANVPVLVFSIINTVNGANILCANPTSIVGDDDYIMLIGGEPFEATTGTAPEIALGVDLACNFPFTQDLSVRYQLFTATSSVHLRVWFYGIPD